jgi:hypothetical protein
VRGLQITLGIAWYVTAVGGVVSFARYRILSPYYVTYWLDTLLLLGVAMVLIHFLKLSKK